MDREQVTPGGVARVLGRLAAEHHERGRSRESDARLVGRLGDLVFRVMAQAGVEPRITLTAMMRLLAEKAPEGVTRGDFVQTAEDVSHRVLPEGPARAGAARRSLVHLYAELCLEANLSEREAAEEIAEVLGESLYGDPNVLRREESA